MVLRRAGFSRFQFGNELDRQMDPRNGLASTRHSLVAADKLCWERKRLYERPDLDDADLDRLEKLIQRLKRRSKQ